MPSPRQSFYDTIAAAVRDLTEHGYDSVARVQEWMRRIREAAIASLIPEHVLDEQLQQAFRASYHKLVDKGMILRHHPGIARFTLEKVRPQLRAELDRRMMASRELIKLNRVAAIEKTVQRFSGWASSVPPGGTDAADKPEVKGDIKKALASLPFEERRVAVDQGHKFVANLNNILATDGGAIAARWRSHWRQTGYDYREDHKERDEQVYVIRGNWALERGLMKLDGHLYTDDITKPGEEVYCRCAYRYIYSLRDLPPGMVTEKGRAELARVKIAI